MSGSALPQNVLDTLYRSLSQHRDNLPATLLEALNSADHPLKRVIDDDTLGSDQVIEQVADLLLASLDLLARRQIPLDRLYQQLAAHQQNNAQHPSEQVVHQRHHERRKHHKPLKLIMDDGSVIHVETRDISLDGVLVSTEHDPQWHLMGQSGVLELSVKVSAQSHHALQAIPMEISINPDEGLKQCMERSGAMADKDGQIDSMQKCYRFPFQVVRVSQQGLGLKISSNIGMFGYALSEEVFDGML